MDDLSNFYASLVKERLGLSLEEYSYDPALEREMADLERQLVDLRLKLESPTIEVGSPLWVRLNTMERRLVDFALKRKISFVDDSWRLKALKQTALEHPDIDPDKRGKGRPRKRTYSDAQVAKNKMLGLTELRQIEDLKKYVRDQFGEDWSDKRAVEKFVADVYAGQRSKDARIRNLLSEQRRILEGRGHGPAGKPAKK